MATTGELRAIIEELQLIDVGDAASYLGEEALAAEEASILNLLQGGSANLQEQSYTTASCEEALLK